MGMIIPPSVPMIVFAMVSGASIGKLFIAGLVPGLLIGITQLILVFYLSRKNGYHPAKAPFDRKDFFRTMLYGVPALAMPVVIVLFVSFGICTASESAGIAVLYSLVIGFFFYKELTVRDVVTALKKTLISSSSIMLIIGFTTIFTWLLTMANVPKTIAGFFLSLNMPLWGYMVLFDLIILMLGTFIDVTPAILLLTPILLPVMQGIGVSELQFGAMMITGMAIGLVTPPVGMCLNACHKINRMPIMEIFKGAAPFITCNVIVLVSISIFPALTTWLPSYISY
jgi:tripartite ATP-independent transporter DctM subunit